MNPGPYSFKKQVKRSVSYRKIHIDIAIVRFLDSELTAIANSTKIQLCRSSFRLDCIDCKLQAKHLTFVIRVLTDVNPGVLICLYTCF